MEISLTVFTMENLEKEIRHIKPLTIIINTCVGLIKNIKNVVKGMCF